jgi:hypothetical protein
VDLSLGEHRSCHDGLVSMFGYCWGLEVGRVLVGLALNAECWYSIACRLVNSLEDVVRCLHCCIRESYVGLLDILEVTGLPEGRGVLVPAVRVSRRHAQ